MAFASSSSSRSAKKPKYVHEFSDEFSALWLHRFDYILAPHPKQGEKPCWTTESRHPLTDRLIQQGAFLYGVRPGRETTYVLLDIDRGSPYHPVADRLAIERICDALEPLGLISHITITSSVSKGLHLYFPFQEPLSSWKIGLVVTTLLENAGFKLIPGWLECFPNKKSFVPNGEQSLFNAHRLPMQNGSYILNDSLQPVGGGSERFFKQWQLATGKNDINAELLSETVRVACRKNYYVSGRAQKFLNDLNADIEPGWTGKGQTNFLLGRIAMRSYIFGHTLGAGEPLKGEALVEDIVSTATSLSGYDEFCGHRHEIQARAREWARCVEGSAYFHYGNGKGSGAVGGETAIDGPSWNQLQQAKARDKIRNAVTALCRQEIWPDGITARFDALCAAGIGGSTLYKNRDLWHPRFIREQQQLLLPDEATQSEPVENPPDPPSYIERGVGKSAGGAFPTPVATSLLGGIDSSSSDGKGSSDRGQTDKGVAIPPDGNSDIKTQEEIAAWREGARSIKKIINNLKKPSS